MLPNLSKLAVTDASVQDASTVDGYSDAFKAVARDSGQRTTDGEVIYTFAADQKIAAHVSEHVGIAKSPGRGLGVFAASDMKKDDFVCLFTGVWATDADWSAAMGTWRVVEQDKETFKSKGKKKTKEEFRWDLVADDPCVDAYAYTVSPQVLPYAASRVECGGVKCSGQDAAHRLKCTPRMADRYQQQLSSGTKETLCSLQFNTQLLPSGDARPLDVGALMNHPDVDPDVERMSARRRKRAPLVPGLCVARDVLVNLTNKDVGRESLHVAIAIFLAKDAKAGQELVFDYNKGESASRANMGLGSRIDVRHGSVSLLDENPTKGGASKLGIHTWWSYGERVRTELAARGGVTRPMVGPPLYFVKCTTTRLLPDSYVAFAAMLSGDRVEATQAHGAGASRPRTGPIIDALPDMMYNEGLPIVKIAKWHLAYMLREQVERLVAADPPPSALTIEQISNPYWAEEGSSSDDVGDSDDVEDGDDEDEQKRARFAASAARAAGVDAHEFCTLEAA